MRDDVSCPHVSELICFSGDSSKKKKGSSVVSSSRKRNSTCKYVDYPTKESTLTCARTWARGRERERGGREKGRHRDDDRQGCFISPVG